MNPPIVESGDAEKEGILEAARLMLISVRTAPKTAGVDDVLGLIVYGKEKDVIADKMDEVGNDRNSESFKRDARNVRNSGAVVLIGVRGSKSVGLNCGGCGFEGCEDFDEAEKKIGRGDFVGPTCVFKALDLGIALGSAAKTSGVLNIDNRVMYRVGTAAMKLRLLPDATVIIGIPISAKGKNIYFDRPVRV